MYIAECRKAQGQFCEAATQSGFLNMHVECIAMRLALVYAGFEEDKTIEHMRRDRDTLAASAAAFPVESSQPVSQLAAGD